LPSGVRRLLNCIPSCGARVVGGIHSSISIKSGSPTAQPTRPGHLLEDGAGILRRSVHEFLKGHPHVATLAEAPQNEGGQGATLVELRQ
jgi:hypothetical protein